MSFAMASLLVHDDRIPSDVRVALRGVHASPPGSQRHLRKAMARRLHDEIGVDCRDALELVDLEPCDCAE